MSRRDVPHPGVTVPVSTSEVRRVTTTSTSACSGFKGPGAASLASPAPEPVPPYSSTSTSNQSYSELHLAPASRTSVVTTTTTTTVHFAPILIPRSKPIKAAYSSFSHDPRGRTPSASLGRIASADQPLSPKSAFASFVDQEERRSKSGNALHLDPKFYPLSQAAWPSGLKKFKLGLGSLDGTFFEDEEDRRREAEDRVQSGAALDGPSSAEKGKGREQHPSATYSLSAGGDVAYNFPSHPPTTHPRIPRSAAGRRRTSRRARNSLSASAYGADGVLGEEDDEEDESVADMLSRPRMSLDADTSAAAIARLPSPGPPPRKRPRATSHERTVTPDPDLPFFSAAAASMASAALPSPNQSPPSPVPTFVGGEDSQECKETDLGVDGADSTLEDEPEAQDHAIDLGSGKALSGLLSLPDFVDTFDQLSPALQSYFIFTFLKRSSIPVLQTINNIIAPSLRRDFLTDLPPELGVHILGYLDAKALCRASVVCKGWRRLVDGEWRVWKERLEVDSLWIGDGSEEREAKEIISGTRENMFLKRWKAGVWNDTPRPGAWNGKEEDESMHIDGVTEQSSRRFSTSVKLASPASSREASPFTVNGHFTHPFKILYRRRFVTRRNWAEREPQRISFPCHANNVVTCLQFDKDKIVSASDDHSINVFETRTGAPRGSPLKGHEGGVWALQYIGNILVSGSTDRTVRIWDLDTGKCTHVFVGHTSTVRCLQIVEPENINPDPNGAPIWEPPYPLIVTGSRDWSLRVWRLPSPNHDEEYHPTVPMSPTEENTDPTENPFHLRHLAGHRHAVRALAAHGKTLVSGSYDCQVRVWDMLTGECKQRLSGHTQKVYSVVFDHRRKQCASGSMDGTVRLWSTESGECKAVLEGHTSLVGLLGLSHRNLVSAAADSTLRVWDPTTGECRHTLAAHSGAITCFQHDEQKVISGSDGTLKMWQVQDGSFTRDLLTGLTGVWQVSFNQRFCVAAVQRNGQSEFEILDFGSVDEEADEDEERIKIEEDDEAISGFTGAGAFEHSPLPTDDIRPARPRHPPPFLRPGEFPRVSPTGAVVDDAALQREGDSSAALGSDSRVPRPSTSAQNLSAAQNTTPTGTSTLSSYRQRIGDVLAGRQPDRAELDSAMDDADEGEAMLSATNEVGLEEQAEEESHEESDASEEAEVERSSADQEMGMDVQQSVEDGSHSLDPPSSAEGEMV